MRRIVCMMMVAVLSGCIGGCGIEGLHSANPSTRITADPWGGFSFRNNKDVNIDLAKGSYDPSTKALIIEGLKVVDSASTVREANVQQIDAVSREATAIGAAWANGFLAAAQLAGLINPIAGGATITGPFGSKLVIQPRQIPSVVVMPESAPSQ